MLKKAIYQASGLEHWAKCLEVHNPEGSAAGIVMLRAAAKTLRELTSIIEKERKEQKEIKE